MRKYIFAALIMLLSVSAFAQEGESNIGFTMGFTEPILRYKASSSATKLSKDVLNGFKAGFVYETSLVKGFGLSIGVNYTLGAKTGDWTQVNTGILYPSYKTNEIYNQFEIPVDWQYKFTIAKETYIIVYTGPTLQCAVNWTEYTTTRLNKTDEIKDMVNHYTDVDDDVDGINDYTRFNITWGVGAGFQYKRYFIRGGYDFGILNPYKDRYYTDSDNGWYHKGRLDQWSVKLGIYLWQFK